MKTYNDLYLEVRRALRNAGVEQFSLEARLLISAAAKKSKEEFVRDLSMYPGPEIEAKAARMVARRLAGEPAAYVLGEWEFMGLPFEVDRDVLIPRPDTETLAEAAITWLRGRPDGARVLDLCCGSGCIGISIAAAGGSSRVVLIDNSMAALRLARRNVLRNNAARNVTCIAADALKAPPVLLGKYDLIVCNPPYIATSEIETLDSSVKDFEPRAALDGGWDGKLFYRNIIPNWKTILKDGGCMMFECGEGQAEFVVNLLRKEGFSRAGTLKDAAGVDRVAAGII